VGVDLEFSRVPASCDGAMIWSGLRPLTTSPPAVRRAGGRELFWSELHCRRAAVGVVHRDLKQSDARLQHLSRYLVRVFRIVGIGERSLTVCAVNRLCARASSSPRAPACTPRKAHFRGHACTFAWPRGSPPLTSLQNFSLSPCMPRASGPGVVLPQRAQRLRQEPESYHHSDPDESTCHWCLLASGS